MIVPARLVQKNPPKNTIFTCGSCQTPWEVTEWSDMSHGLGAENRDSLFILCPGCKKSTAMPDETNMANLIRLFEEWRVLQESLPPKWNRSCYCDECQTSSTINETNLVMVDKEVKIKCPVCRSLIPSEGIVPSGIISELLNSPSK